MVDSIANWFQNKIAMVRTGNLGGGSLSGDGFSLGGALIAMIVAVVLFVLLRVPFLRWIPRRFEGKQLKDADKPSIAFYADTLQELSRIGLIRRAEQTPAEFSHETAKRCSQHAVDGVSEPLSVLTSAFYDQRYGNDSTPTGDVRAAFVELKKRIDHLVANKPLRNDLMTDERPKTEQVS